jgi:hypothetical protein
MLNSEKLGIAAHLHVLLRRKTGRVTDTEWMATNTDYAAEIVRFSRASALSDGHTDLGEWADKLAAAMLNLEAPRSLAKRIFVGASAPDTQPAALIEPGGHRYVRGIR